MSDSKSPECHEYQFHGLRCEVYTTEDSLKYYPVMPWRFRIHRDGGRMIQFIGVPNYCESRRSAMMRAMHRCRWIANGDFDVKYT